MKKIYLYLLFFTVISSQDLIAQNEWSLKLYQNTDFYHLIEDYDITNQGTLSQAGYKTDFSRLSMSLHLNPKNSWEHELSVSFSDQLIPLAYTINKNYEQVSSSNFYSIEYEMLRELINTNKKLKFLIGGSLFNYWTRLNHHSFKTYFFTYQQYRGSIFNLVPHVEFRPLNRLILDLNFRFGLFELRQYQYYIDNPSLPEEWKVYQKEIQSTFLPKTSTLRFGIGYQIK